MHFLGCQPPACDHLFFSKLFSVEVSVVTIIEIPNLKSTLKLSTSFSMYLYSCRA